MEQKKARVEYSITIKGSDGSVKECTTTNFVLVATDGDLEGTVACSRYQANFFELFAMYATILQEKEKIERINKLVPALYNAVKLNEDVILKEKVDVDGGAV